MDILARKTARRTKVRRQVGEEVRVGVGVRVGPVEFKLYQTGPLGLLEFSLEVTSGQRESCYAGVYFWRQNDRWVNLMKSVYL